MEGVELVELSDATRDAAGALLAATGLSAEGLEGGGPARFWVALEAARVVGVGGLEGLDLQGGAVLLRTVAVARHRQDRGLGTLLTRFLLQRARAAGARRVYLFSTGAGHFWQLLGFREVPVDELAEALAGTPQVRAYRERGLLPREVAWAMDL